jgi:beta-glucosidase
VTVQPVTGSAEQGVTVTTVVTNVGDRSGEAVAELYLKPPAFEGAPRIALRGFRRTSLAPGAHETLTFALSPRDLSFVTRDGERAVMAGQYLICVGAGQPDTDAAVQTVGLTISKSMAVPR